MPADLVVGQVAVVALVENDVETERVRGPVERIFADSVTVRLEGESVPLPFAPGSKVTVTYHERYGLYAFPARILLREAIRIVVERTGETAEVQRRQYVRLTEPIPVECLTVDDVTGKLFPLEATTMNVSGGGLAVETNRVSVRNSRVVVVLRPGQQPPILGVADVVASEPRSPGAAEVVTRLTFAAVAEADRERLIRYVFENLR